MRVCHLTSVHSHTDTRIFIKECQSLARAGYEVHLVAPGAPSAVLEEVHVHGIEKEESSRLKRMAKAMDKVYKKGLEIDADVYHFHDPELIPVGLKLKKKGKKVIYDVHEDVPRQILNKSWLPFKSQKVISKLFETYEEKASKKFDLLITATAFIRDRFLDIKANAVDVNNFPILNELKTDDVSWESKESSVCYVGGISKVRGVEEMVRAMEMTEGISLLMGGNFIPPNGKEEVMKYKGWNKVKHLGFLNRMEVKGVYQRSIAGLVLLHPRINYMDALPVKMFEYMAAGIPVIASNFPVWKSIVEGNDCGLCVDPLNPKEIAEAITFMKENPGDAERMGQNGRKAVENIYNWEQESIKLIDAYEKLR
ncbi:glycosyltransferase [Siminovitchia acidinfaciens]|uniref:Glycosyltransferase n=1 Tax=Siminovitchia acidinfaciens TaxID=2321395 RepID=A0A429XZI7_9BACI|nr:glycosyltransferase family 4 protein [Siminovitchia acidinfaciens]RST74187.1 glycosyltransferase [Siminovitchia acidinfaciens]